LLGGFAVRTWVVRGLLVPIRVASGSMADALSGPHWRVPCEDCGFVFRCGREFPPRLDRAVCPNCGYAGNDLPEEGPRGGQRVLIDCLTYRLRPPRRWEMVAARLPDRSDRLAVKRVVALPGERVSIQNGDVYINGLIQRKTLRQQRQMAILVHDNDFQPARDRPLPARWQTDRVRSSWQQTHGRLVHTPEAVSEPGQTTEDPGRRPTDIPIDWITYHHWPCLPPPAARTDESPVMDHYGYNQGLSRALNEVTDLILSFSAKLSGTGVLAMRAHDGRERFEIRWDPVQQRIRLWRQDRQVAQARFHDPWDGQHKRIELSVCDQQVLVACDGQVQLTYAYPAAARPARPSPRPFSLGAWGVLVKVRHLRVYRDVWYIHPPPSGRDVRWDRTLTADQYLLLGDNSPVTTDSRDARAGRVLVVRAIVGRVIPFRRSPSHTR
jgi:signal peptidase I